MRTLVSILTLFTLGYCGLAHASFAVTCRPAQMKPGHSGAFLSSFDLALVPEVSATISNAKLGPGLIDIARDNREPIVPMPTSDLGHHTNLKHPLPSGVERFSRFRKIFSNEGFWLTLDVNSSDNTVKVKAYWRSTDDWNVRELYLCH